MSQPKFTLLLHKNESHEMFRSLGISDERDKILKDVIVKCAKFHMNEKRDGLQTEMLKEIVENCENVEEIVMCTYMIGRAMGEMKVMSNKIKSLIRDFVGEGADTHEEIWKKPGEN